jgi:hypothetical protein
MTPLIVAYTLCLPVIAYLGLASVQLAVRSARTTGRLVAATTSATTSVAPSPDGPRFVVILPMLREDGVVEAACRQFLGLAHPIEVVVAVTAREERERDEAHAALVTACTRGRPDDIADPLVLRALDAAYRDDFRTAVAAGNFGGGLDLLERHRRGTTAETARQLFPRVAADGTVCFRLVVAPEGSTGKVGQLNAALRSLGTGDAPHPDEATYVAVYDADSRPDLSVLDAVAVEAASRRRQGLALPAVFQQVSCYCLNLRALSGWRGALSLADALAQTRWALGFEFALYDRFSRAVRGDRRRPLAYCVGHGCLVSLRWLREIGGFPTVSPNDDLAMGYLASTLGAEIAPVAALDFCDVAPDPLVSVRQSRFWYLGSARFHRDLRYFRTLPGATRDRVQHWLFAVNGHGRNLAWAWRGVAWMAALVLAIAVGSPVLIGAAMVVHVCYAQVGFAQTVYQLRRLPAARSRVGITDLPVRLLVTAGLFASAVFVLRGIGPLIGSLQLLVRRTRGGEWKVER